MVPKRQRPDQVESEEATAAEDMMEDDFTGEVIEILVDLEAEPSMTGTEAMITEIYAASVARTPLQRRRVEVNLRQVGQQDRQTLSYACGEGRLAPKSWNSLKSTPGILQQRAAL